MALSKHAEELYEKHENNMETLTWERAFIYIPSVRSATDPQKGGKKPSITFGNIM